MMNLIKLIQVALNNLENILKVGEIDKADGINQFVLFVEEAGGMEKIHNLQNHENLEIYKKAYHIIDKYFAEDEEEDPNLAPEMDVTTGQFAFQTDVNMPQPNVKHLINDLYEEIIITIKLIQVALDGLENILKVGEIDKADGINQFTLFVEEAEDEEEDPNLAPEMNATTGQFAFQTDVNMPQGGFHFGDNSNPM
ncbi:unnamed protein product [Rhizophagus irregularis]|nr:unnamed protein product [Rhizophagus irregularis]